jgi:hypothetical protein
MKTILISLALVSLVGCAAPNVNDNTPHTTITGKIAGQPFSIQNPKDTILDGLSVTASTNGTASISIAHLSTVMNPTNINATGDAGEKIIAANGAAIVNGINAAASAASQLAAEAAKAVIKP